LITPTWQINSRYIYLGMSAKKLLVFGIVVFLGLSLFSCKRECIQCFGKVSKEFYRQCDPPDSSLIVPLAGDTISGCTEVFKVR